VEDFAQLTGMDRETKYDFSMEKIIPVLDLCTFPLIEKVRLFRRCIFNYLIGNEDMHLKNYSLITRAGKTELAPAYDFLSSTSAYLALGKQPDQIEETALTLNGKKRNLTRKIWIDYFATERLGLNSGIISEELERFSKLFDRWYDLIDKSFLSASNRNILVDLIKKRRKLLSL
jgi:serine/threonine-protein kinase HipA